MLQGFFKGESRELQGHLKEVQRVFQGSFPLRFKKVSKVFKECFKCVLGKFQKSYKGVSKMC